MDELAKLAKSYHDPRLQEEHMVLSWWYDGEETLEKGGDLFGKRNCHMVKTPVGKKQLPKDFNNGEGRVFVTEDQAADLRQKLTALQV